MARTGYVAKGTVYAITGVLTFLAAFNLGGQKTGKLQVIEFLEKQPFGKALLILIGLGFLCYSCWRFIQAIQDPEGEGKNAQAKLERTGFFASGLLYLILAGYSIMQAFNPGSSSGSSQQKASFLAGDAGVYIYAIVGMGLIIASFYQFKKVFTGTFLDKFKERSVSETKRRKTIEHTGKMGLAARGTILAILAYFFIHAAIVSNITDIKGTADAFSFLQEYSYGSWLMGLVAAGLVCYSVYVFMMVRYREFKD
ncbi:DUF1206 domain-containing protein [Zunongwangia sp. F363]|uniref:DUF1206 domain-containing protein n=1 Tax=Autumnicola tepida TaxID=3075595 RepID=A0ABU3C602_9FLAO|nr:DUF1206 domain-containing protein [Zunongwangia sp. F363]MDT0641744.1 DUF1206 domain-containing protein [Zunongwangia sp. F363]